jgi:hypothetical protein
MTKTEEEIDFENMLYKFFNEIPEEEIFITKEKNIEKNIEKETKNEKKCYKAPIGAKVNPCMKCPVNTLYVETTDTNELNLFLVFPGIQQIKVLKKYSFITFDTVESATRAMNKMLNVCRYEISYANNNARPIFRNSRNNYYT